MATKTGKSGDKEVPRCPLCEGLIEPGDDAEIDGEVGTGSARLVCSDCMSAKDDNRQLTEF